MLDEAGDDLNDDTFGMGPEAVGESSLLLRCGYEPQDLSSDPLAHLPFVLAAI